MSDLGVVDPIRLPAPLTGLGDRFRQLPALARAFVGIAAIDALARLLGVVEPRGFTVNVVGIVGFFVPRDLWILLPALLLIRRPTAADDTPQVFRGAVLIALVTLVSQPTQAFLIGTAGDPDLSLLVGFGVITSVLLAWGYIWLGLGLTALNPGEPRPPVAGLANLVGGGIVLAVAAQLVVAVAIGSRSALEPWLDTASIVGAVALQLALAFFLRAVVRGLGDPGRPGRATRAAAAGAALLAVAVVLEGALAIVGATLQDSPSSRQTLIAISQWSSTVAAVLDLTGYVLLVLGFAWGLASPLRPLAGEWAAALRADPRAEATPR